MISPEISPEPAITSRRETAAIGLSRTSARAFMAARPTRSPVNEPGPEATAKASISSFFNLCLISKAEICGTSCAEKVPPSSGTRSRVSGSPRPNRTSAMLPWFPEVSAPRISISVSRLDQFEQHASGARGMDKNVIVATGPGLDLFRDKANALVLQLSNRASQIGNSQANVVQSPAALGNKFCDHRVLARGFQQFQAGIADGDHDHTNFLRWDELFRRSAQAERLVNRPRRLERFHRNAEMVETNLHGSIAT